MNAEGKYWKISSYTMFTIIFYYQLMVIIWVENIRATLSRFDLLGLCVCSWLAIQRVPEIMEMANAASGGINKPRPKR